MTRMLLVAALTIPLSAAAKAPAERRVMKTYTIKEPMVVEGHVQKPGAIYILQRSALDYAWEALNRDARSKIGEATRNDPF